MYFKLLSIMCMFYVLKDVDSHGRLVYPPGRSSMWRYWFDTPENFNDNQLYCGGFQHQQEQDGRCGLCGDPYDGPLENEAGGKYATDAIAKCLAPSETTLGVSVQLTANHLGYFEFKLCENNDYKKKFTQDCLDKHPLKVSGNGSTKYYPGAKVGLHNLTLEIPAGLTCDQCVLQWRYHTGNSWGVGEDGKGCIGCGPQEEFYACSDIKISNDCSSSHHKVSTQNPTTNKPTRVTTSTPKTTSTTVTTKTTTIKPTTKPTTASTTTIKSTTVSTTKQTTSKPTTTPEATPKPTTAPKTASAPTTVPTTTSKPTTASKTTAKLTTMSATKNTTTKPTAEPKTTAKSTQMPTTKQATFKPSTSTPTPTTATAKISTNTSTRIPSTSTTIKTSIKPATSQSTTVREIKTTMNPTKKVTTTSSSTNTTEQEKSTTSPTTKPNETTKSNNSYQGKIVRICVATGDYKNDTDVTDWCMENCNVGFCPRTHCACQDSVGDKFTVLTCRGYGEYSKVPGIDDWCQVNCLSNSGCPLTHCVCSRQYINV